MQNHDFYNNIEEIYHSSKQLNVKNNYLNVEQAHNL